MAINEVQATQIENSSESLQARGDRITAQINDYVRTVNTRTDPSSAFVTDGKALEAEAVDTINAINTFNNSSAVLEGRSDPIYSERVNASVEIIQASRNQTATALVDIRSTLDTLGTESPPDLDATNSAAQIIGDDALNRTENSTVQNPGTTPDQGNQVVETASNADSVTTRGLADFDDEENNAIEEDSGSQAPTLPTTTSGINEINVNKGYREEIKPKENLLSRFGTSTYGITIYMITPGQYNKMMGYGDDANAGNDADAQAVKSVEGLSAILSSGGLPNGLIGDPYTIGGATRNRFFNLDYFIDDLEIQTLLPQQVRGATNVTQLSFKITEPYGFTFLNRLKNASEELMANFSPESATGARDWIRQHYLMVIRFYGQEDGAAEREVTETAEGGYSDGVVNVVAQRPLSEKYIPFQFTNITTKAATGAVEYECSAVPINHLQAMGQKNSTAKYQVEIQGQTLENLFNGKLSQEVDGNENRLLSTGLVESINSYYKKLESEGTIGIAPEFEVKFRDGIGKQKVKAPGSTKKDRTAMANINPALISASSNSVQKNRINFSINAGSQIQQVLDLIIRSSEWITKQQKKFIDPNTKEVKNKSSNNVLQWYRITSSVKVLGWDDIRQDYSYKIIYQVTSCSVGDVKSPFFPKKKFNGCQKRYKYWFTGENTEILNYEVDFNALYYVSSSPLVAQERDQISTIGETTNPGPPDQSIVGGSDQSSDPAARAASVLYSPTDYALLSMKILGDPFYIQQGDIFWRSFGVQDNDPGYLPDGSADFDSGEVLIEVDYNTMEDYDTDTGMADVRPIELKPSDEIENTTTTSGVIYKGLIYQITQVNNSFSKGMFTQDLQGVLKQYPGEYTNSNSVSQDPEVRPIQFSQGANDVNVTQQIPIPPLVYTSSSVVINSSSTDDDATD
jgi:hypothetical protein